MLDGTSSTFTLESFSSFFSFHDRILHLPCNRGHTVVINLNLISCIKNLRFIWRICVLKIEIQKKTKLIQGKLCMFLTGISKSVDKKNVKKKRKHLASSQNITFRSVWTTTTPTKMTRILRPCFPVTRAESLGSVLFHGVSQYLKKYKKSSQMCGTLYWNFPRPSAFSGCFLLLFFRWRQPHR